MEPTKNRAEIGDRINELLFLLNLNQSSFAELVGTTQTTVRNVTKGITKPRYEFIASVLKAIPTLSNDWLMEGKGEPFPKDGPKAPGAAIPKADDYLMEQLHALEATWKSTIKEKEKTILEKEKIITQQTFMIETLMSQLNTSLGKLDLSEEILPVSGPIVIPFPHLRVAVNNTLHTASLTAGK
jgi:transcriptional regulator with XRE-family HTH domain